VDSITASRTRSPSSQVAQLAVGGAELATLELELPFSSRIGDNYHQHALMYVYSRYFVLCFRGLHLLLLSIGDIGRACELIKHGLVLPALLMKQRWRTLIRSNARSRSDSESASTSPLPQRPQPDGATLLDASGIQASFHSNSWAKGP
jgi:hypothetical protein